MPTIWDAALQNVGANFEAFAVGLSPVTINQIDPDTGAVLASVPNVPAQTVTRKRQGGDMVPDDAAPFTFRADRLGFTPKNRDQIVDAAGQVWVIESVTLILGQLAQCQTVVKRG